ncbi:TonB-dependent receptor domain-containing protein [Sphingomonas sp. DT-207]|uniref:TonB-dependent receptor domain-containing protein n=1 Tax=Sphingomonas sp. DT-207 TaxID=3396167 RepID=UPI003F1AD2F1
MKLSRLLGATALASVSFIVSQTAYAQTAEPSADEAAQQALEEEEGPAEEVLITGSRIARPELEGSIPVTSLSAQEILGTRGDVSLGDALNQLPQLRSTFSQANSTGSIGTAGLNFLDLRGLGTTRTLTLVNGRRVVSASPGDYRVDVNTIPSDLVERVETVTGGNSAIYGSDAIAGVVNFVLKRDFEGVKIRAQGGTTSYGDRGSYLVSGIAGKNFGDGRFNVTVSGEYANSQALFYSDRSYLGATNTDGRGGVPGFINSQITTAPNRNFDGIPNTSFVDGDPGVTFGNISLGGYVITSCPAATATNAAQRNLVCTGGLNPTGGRINYNYAFMPDGTLVRDDPSRGLVDNRGIGGGVLGGLSATGVEDAMLLPGLERYTGNFLFRAELSPAFQPFVEASYTRVNALQQSTQPTFIASTLSPTFSVNNPFLTAQARSTLTQILNPGATSFTMQRFNNDFGTRAEMHNRDTYRAVVGIEGDLSDKGNLRYEVAFNYGRTENYYETGGNVHLQHYRNAIAATLAPAGYAGSNYVLNSAGQRVVCGINADASSANDDAACYPLNVFGYRASSQQALDYVLHRSYRNQWAEEIDFTAYLSGDTEGFFNLPGGPVGFAIGGEYRSEDAYSAYDDVTISGATFLNSSLPFDPPKVEIKEAYGELRIPLLRDITLLRELTFEGAARISDYGGDTGAVWAWNAGLVWSPIRDLRLRGTYSRSVRAPNLTNLYATQAETFANSLTDPCDQAGGTNATNNINANPNRVRNCAAAGIPTTITYTDSSGNAVTRPWTNVPGSGVSGFNQGNPDLVPEVGYSFTLGAVYQPEYLRGFTFVVDYYNIRVNNVIQGLTGQQIINRCYDDPVGIENPFCAVVFRRSGTGSATADYTFDGQTSRRLDNTPDVVLPKVGPAFLNQPFNFAGLKTRGIDFDASYNHKFDGGETLSLRLVASYVMDRLSYSYITAPEQYDRLDSMLGDPKWAGKFSALLDLGNFDISYDGRYVGKQIVSDLSYETFFSSQGRPPLNPDARPFVFYDPQVYHSIRLGVDANDKFRFYMGVDNITNELPPYELAGVGDDAVYPNIGRFFYAGASLQF